GSFAYSKNRPDAPDPLLTIKNRLISLPLSEIDARYLNVCSDRPWGDGGGIPTIINPSLVSFQNPAWESFLQSNIADISSCLGLPGGYEIRHKLHELVVYETPWLTTNSIQEEDGMFATMLVVLPSQYTGGEITVSHGPISKVIDDSTSCMTNIRVLSWYTDVKQKLKSITSGYRLVLSYSLIRRSLSGPEVMPTAANTSELARLHEILERWHTGGYRQLPRHCMVGLVLGHHYSESELDIGQAALKGQDAHKVNQISPVAQMLGFELWLAKLQHWRSILDTETDYDSDGLECRPRPSPDQYQLDYFTDLKGNRVLGKIEYFDPKGLINVRNTICDSGVTG
ncbi:hypothetical protein JOM56_011939, partial [Amanita muscaria]